MSWKGKSIGSLPRTDSQELAVVTITWTSLLSKQDFPSPFYQFLNSSSSGLLRVTTDPWGKVPFASPPPFEEKMKEEGTLKLMLRNVGELHKAKLPVPT